MSEPDISLTREVTGAALWSYAGVFADRFIRFLLFLVIARLVSPSDFGVVLLSMLTVELLQAALDTGLATALIRQTEVAQKACDSAFTISVAAAGVMTALLFAGAPLLALVSHEARAAPMLRALAFAPLLSGLGSVHVTLLQRELGFKKLAARRAFAGLAASVAALALAFAGAGAWALVARTLLLAAGGSAAAWFSHPFRPRLRLDRLQIRRIAPTGLRLWAAGVAQRVNARGFDLLAGFVLGATALAALRIAGQMVMLLTDLTATPLTAVGFSVMSRAHDDPVRRREAFVAFASLSAFLLFPAFAGLLVVADPLLPLMFGARWARASVLLPFMCAVAPPLYGQLCITAALFAAGRADRIFSWSLIEAALTAALGLIGARFGLIGLAAAGTLRMYVMAPLALRWLDRDAGLSPWLLFAAAWPSALAATVMAGVAWMLKQALQGVLAPAPLVATLIAAGIATYAVLSPRTWAWLRRSCPGFVAEGTLFAATTNRVASWGKGKDGRDV